MQTKIVVGRLDTQALSGGRLAVETKPRRGRPRSGVRPRNREGLDAPIRHIASRYAYDSYENGGENTLTLRQNSDEIADVLVHDLQKRLGVAGVDVIEARIMHLAYSSEIAAAMLQRQQANAVLSARKVIVDGAVGLVKAAIDQLQEQEIVELDEEKKAQMVNNLMVAIVSEKGTQPIINTGSIY